MGVLVGPVVPDFTWRGYCSSEASPQLCRSRNLILSGHRELTDGSRTNSLQRSHRRPTYKLEWHKEPVGVMSSVLLEHVRKPVKTIILLGEHWIEVRMGEDEQMFLILSVIWFRCVCLTLHRQYRANVDKLVVGVPSSRFHQTFLFCSQIVFLSMPISCLSYGSICYVILSILSLLIAYLYQKV